MRIPKPETLKLFRGRGMCEYGPHWSEVRQCAHVQARGRGDAFRNDDACNLIGLCCEHHSASHNGGHPTTIQLAGIVAEREGVPLHQLIDWLLAVRWAEPGSDIPEKPWEKTDAIARPSDRELEADRRPALDPPSPEVGEGTSDRVPLGEDVPAPGCCDATYDTVDEAAKWDRFG